MSNIPKPHEIYKHFKGNLYQITAIAEHTETGKQLVIYQALYGDFKTYARPLEMFMSKVDRQKYPDAAQEYRFELQNMDGGRRDSEELQESASEENVREENVPNEDGEQLDLDPMVIEFLDARTYEERLNILEGLRNRITDEMITIMAVACDVEVPEGGTEERFASLKNCLMMMEKYECNRLR